MQKAVLLAGPPLAAILLYRAAVRQSVRPGPAVVAAAAYGLGALTLWTFSEGRLGLLLALAVLPAAAERVETAFGREEPPGGRRRFVAGSAVTLAVGIAAFPGIVLAIALLVGIRVGLGPARLRGLLLISLSVLGAAVLLFPFVPTLLADGGSPDLPRRHHRAGASRPAGARARAGHLDDRCVPPDRGGPRPRTRPWLTPGPGRPGRGRRGAGLTLSWLAAANYLPPGLSNPPAFAAAAAVSMATLIGFGLTSFTGSLRLSRSGCGRSPAACSPSSWERGSSCNAWP